MHSVRFPSFAALARIRGRAQDTVEYGLVVAGAALLALLSYTMFTPIVTAAVDQVKALLPSFH
jgi:hypothetical protein